MNNVLKRFTGVCGIYMRKKSARFAGCLLLYSGKVAMLSPTLTITANELATWQRLLLAQR